jgi:hypothetical protein
MGEEGKSKSWWQTLPGIITTVTATITALTGLVVAINQTGWFGSPTLPAAARGSASTPSTLPGAASPAVPAQAPPVTTSPLPPAGPAYPVELPAMRDYRLGAATFGLLKAEVSPRTNEKDALRVRLRMTNHDRYDTNFWDRSFRLIVDGVPMAPEDGLNELVPAQAAKEGDVTFVIPRGTTSAKLKIAYANDSTEIPLILKSPR